MKSCAVAIGCMILVLTALTGCDVLFGGDDSDPDPVLLDTDFESGMPSTLRTWRMEEDGCNYDTFEQDIVDDDGHKVLRLETYPEEDWPEQPKDSHFAYPAGSNRYTIDTSRTYEIEYRFKIVEGYAGGFHVTFRYYSGATDDEDRTSFTYYPNGIEQPHNIAPGGYINIKYPDGVDGEDFFDLSDEVNLDNGTWYTMRILCEPEKFSMFLDGELFFDHRDEHELYRRAEVWWGAYHGSIVHIDTIRIAYVDDV